MTRPATSPVRESPTALPVRGGPWPGQPTYDRGAYDQAIFKSAVARLWAEDYWVNPRTGERELNADLVLEGGGVKGIGLAGAICVLAEAGYRFPRAAGTSAGAILAVLVAAVEKSGRDMSVLRQYLADIDYTQFKDSARAGIAGRLLSKFTDIFKLISRGGLYSGDYLGTWLGGKLADCGVRTWANLAITADDDPGMSLPPERRYRAVVHVSDISRGMLARLPWHYRSYYGLTTDEQSVVSAVRASMSIPFFFVPVQTDTFQAQTMLSDGQQISWPGGRVTWVDGAMLMNFPIDAFDRTDGQPSRWPTIGIKLSAEPGPQLPDVPVNGAIGEVYRCLKTMTNEWDRYYVDQATADRTIFVNNAGITATQFDLSRQQQEILFRNGAQAATDFLIKWAHVGGIPRGKR